MLQLIKRSRKKIGLSPGTLIHIGDKKIGTVKMSLMNYDPEQLLEKELTSIEDAFPYKDTPPAKTSNRCWPNYGRTSRKPTPTRTPRS